MSRFSLNLARRPFVNQRPVVRLAVLSWVVGIGLAGLNGWLYFAYLAATRSQSAGLVEADQRIERAQEGLAAAETALSGLDLAHQNQRAAYLNDRIAERTFSWSQLFDDLAKVLPREVRLFSVTPQRPRDRRRAPGDTSPTKPSAIAVQLRGAGENDEAVLELVDAMFGHPAFANPDLRHENRVANGQTEFDLQVGYRTLGAAARSAVEARLAVARPTPDAVGPVPLSAPASATRRLR